MCFIGDFSSFTDTSILHHTQLVAREARVTWHLTMGIVV